jgi:hypothetical protein
MENKKTSKSTVTVELSVEELDLIRHATWSLERELQDDIKEYNVEEEDSFYKVKSYWIRKNEIDKNMFFDSSALRDKVIKAHREMATSEEHLSYQKENNLTTGNISARYSNNEDG